MTRRNLFGLVATAVTGRTPPPYPPVELVDFDGRIRLFSHWLHPGVRDRLLRGDLLTQRSRRLLDAEIHIRSTKLGLPSSRGEPGVRFCAGGGAHEHARDGSSSHVDVGGILASQV